MPEVKFVYKVASCRIIKMPIIRLKLPWLGLLVQETQLSCDALQTNSAARSYRLGHHLVALCGVNARGAPALSEQQRPRQPEKVVLPHAAFHNLIAPLQKVQEQVIIIFAHPIGGVGIVFHPSDPMGVGFQHFL